MYAWVIHSLRAAGLPHLLSEERHQEVLDMLGVPAEWRYVPDRPTPIGHCPPKGEGMKEGCWLRRWVDGYSGREGLPLVRPPYTPREEDGVWAEQVWATRAKGKPRVLVMPYSAWHMRCWTDEHWIAVCNALEVAGVCTMVVAGKYDPDHRFPYLMGGLPLRRVWALTRAAHCLAGVHSGPALWASTMGLPVVAVGGPTDPSWVYGHLGEGPGKVVSLAVDRAVMPCVGCEFKPERGWRGTCRTCVAMMMLSPWEVVRAVLDEVGMEEVEVRRDVRVNMTRGRREIV